MKQKTPRNEHPPTPFNYRRFRAAIALPGLSIDAIARRCQISSAHLWYVVTGQRRPSAELLAKIRALLGESSWAYFTGQTDALCDASPASEVATNATV